MVKKPQKRIKHVPQRTCIGCRSTLAKKELIRIVRTPQGIQVDPSGKLAGRGAYVHNVRSCWEQAIKGPINHALRMEISAEDREMLKRFIDLLPKNEAESASDENPGSTGNKDFEMTD